ncbi:MAG: SMP-30/gluconolactonase/LRE family protein [Thermoflexales bacterium]|nr:SMP-30/gluconolactonase/LRE family protein [Thermoflexales bacterium]
MTPELIAHDGNHTGENPLWHPFEHALYWTDIPAGKLYRFDPATGKHACVFSGEPVGGFTVQADGSLLLFMARGQIAVWHGGALRAIHEDIPAERDTRFNDVIADPVGRVFCGTMSTPTRSGRLYRLDRDGRLHELFDGVGVSNGMGFTLDRRGMYYTDSVANEIYLFDYDIATGALSNRRMFDRVAAGAGHPDGMTVDAEGCVWSARWDGSCLVRYSQSGDVLQSISFPARKVSSLTFGDADYGTMYVTTALTDGDPAREGAGAGGLFRVRGVATGLPEFLSRIDAGA